MIPTLKLLRHLSHRVICEMHIVNKWILSKYNFYIDLWQTWNKTFCFAIDSLVRMDSQGFIHTESLAGMVAIGFAVTQCVGVKLKKFNRSFFDEIKVVFRYNNCGWRTWLFNLWYFTSSQSASFIINSFYLLSNILILVSIKINCPIKNVLKQVDVFTKKKHILYYSAGRSRGDAAGCFQYFFTSLRRNYRVLDVISRLQQGHSRSRVAQFNSKMKAKTRATGPSLMRHMIHVSSLYATTRALAQHANITIEG